MDVWLYHGLSRDLRRMLAPKDDLICLQSRLANSAFSQFTGAYELCFVLFAPFSTLRKLRYHPNSNTIPNLYLHFSGKLHPLH